MSDRHFRSERRRVPRGILKFPRDLLYSTLRFIARHIKGFFGAVVAFLTVGFVVGISAAVLFVITATVVAAGFTQTFDDNVLEWFARHRTPRLDELMLDVTSLGNGIVLVVLVLVAAVFLWQTRHHWSVYLLVIGTVGGDLLNTLLKEYFERPRPSVVIQIDTVSSMSFPSGHAMVSLIVYGSVAYLVGRLEPTAGLRRTTWAFAVLIILSIGISRVYLGVHYPSDVIAGFIAGLAWLAFVASGVTAVRFFAPRRPETATEEKDLNAEQQREAGVRE
jgi:undecaprenyl-diphosphatase